jgi:hypothetical protein
MAMTPPKLREPEARILALRIAATFPRHEAETSQIKDAVPGLRKLGPADLKPSTKRKNECMWQQIVGNVVSHEKTSTSIFNQGYAARLSHVKGIRVTPEGLAYLKKLGY